MRLLWNGARCSWPVSTGAACRSSRMLGEKNVSRGRKGKKRKRRGSTQVVEEVSTLGRAARCQREEGGQITATAQAWRGVVASRRCSRPDQRCRSGELLAPECFRGRTSASSGNNHPLRTKRINRFVLYTLLTWTYFLMSCDSSGEQLQSPGEQLQLPVIVGAHLSGRQVQ